MAHTKTKAWQSKYGKTALFKRLFDNRSVLFYNSIAKKATVMCRGFFCLAVGAC
jgi:hypothetical protein